MGMVHALGSRSRPRPCQQGRGVSGAVRCSLLPAALSLAPETLMHERAVDTDLCPVSAHESDLCLQVLAKPRPWAAAST